MPIGSPVMVFGTAIYNGVRFSVCNSPPEVKEYRAQVFADPPYMDCEQDILDFTCHVAKQLRQQYSASHGRKIEFTPLEDLILTRVVREEFT